MVVLRGNLVSTVATHGCNGDLGNHDRSRHSFKVEANPTSDVKRSLYDAAKKTKRGPKVKEGIFISTNINPLAYKGPRTIEGLWADENFRHLASAKVTTSRVMRCRPVFTEWAAEAEGILDPDIIDFAELQHIAETAGDRIGMGDWRPRYGRYTATVAKA